MKRDYVKYAILQLILALSIGCSSVSNDYKLINPKNFECLHNGKQISLHTLRNTNGLTMQITNYGARVVSLWVPDRNGKFDDIVLGYDNIEQYIENPGERFLGAAIGRFANRIANGKFTLLDSTYVLPQNNNGQTLHGGEFGLDRVVWYTKYFSENRIQFTYFSVDGEEGFPGNLSIDMTYELTDDNAFIVTYSATTDKATPVNLTHHSFFNLKGEGGGTINNHILKINADYYLPINTFLIPLGYTEEVANSPFDFRTPKCIEADINAKHVQLINAKGYDHNFVLRRESYSELEMAATIYEPLSGREMQVWTSEPGLQFYGGNFFDGKAKGKNSHTHNYREAFALETQRFPDAPNQIAFPSTILNPGDTYTHICKYKFLTK
ncbi:MAG: aldose epimerase family protein [Marinifilaceae bacterium]